MKRILSAGVLALVLSGTALAQGGSGSDFTGPGGAGAGLGGSLGAFLPSPNGLAPGSGINVGNRMSAARGNSSVAVANRLVGGALTNAPGAVTALTSSLTASNVGSTQASALATALAAFGSAPTLANLQAAVTAYNDAVRSMPAGTARQSADMRTVRHALLRLGARTGRPSA